MSSNKMDDPATHATKTVTLEKHKANHTTVVHDHLAVEEPLDIRIVTQDESVNVTHNIAVTMRTPGHDLSLAVGFLFSESLVQHCDDVDWPATLLARETADCNRIDIVLRAGKMFDPQQLSRHVFTSSSCGVCGKITRDNLVQRLPPQPTNTIRFRADHLQQLPRRLHASQAEFQQTGGLHACGLFDSEGRLLSLFEDVGRHNALDKLIGAALRNGALPAHNQLLLLSGRVSFELVQKAGLAGIRFLAAIGAPSSLAVELAKDIDMTLVGFLKPDCMNIYHGGDRLIF